MEVCQGKMEFAESKDETTTVKKQNKSCQNMLQLQRIHLGGRNSMRSEAVVEFEVAIVLSTPCELTRELDKSNLKNKRIKFEFQFRKGC